MAGPTRGRMGWALPLFVLCLGFLWRMPVTVDAWSLPLCENDSLFHLHLAERTLETYPLAPSTDSWVHYPSGYRLHWLAPHTFFYASIAAILEIPAGIPALAATLAVIPPLLGIVSIGLTMAVATFLSPFILSPL